MKYRQTDITNTVEILATDQFQAIPVVVAGTSVVKAGMPLKLDGTSVPSGTGADGILLYDVDPNDNPNAALVVSGIVDWEKCQDHSGATATAATMKGVLPAITFRENIGATQDTSVGGDGSDGDKGGEG